MASKILVACLLGYDVAAVQLKHQDIASSCESSPQARGIAFGSFMAAHGRTYEQGSKEYTLRRDIFNRQLSKIERHNCKPARSWTAALNKFADRTEAELSAHHGYNRHAKSARPTLGYTKLTRSHSTNKSLPEEVGYKHLNAMKKDEIMDQGQCGSCWAAATSLVLRSHSELYQKGTKFSTQELVSCAPNPKHCGGTGGCEGSTGELALEYVMKNGLMTEEEFPYEATDKECPKKTVREDGGASIGMTGWTQLPTNRLEPLQRALAEKGPVAVSVAADDWWFIYSTGILSTCSTDDPIVNHLVVLIGYGEEKGTKYWEIQNSWGSSWGESGHMKLFRSDDEESFCGMDDKPQDGVACEGEDDPVKVCGNCGMLYDAVVPDFVDDRR